MICYTNKKHGDSVQKSRVPKDSKLKIKNFYIKYKGTKNEI